MIVTKLLASLLLIPAPAAVAADSPYDVLVFSRTAGFRHDSIAAGTQAVRELGASNNFSVTATEDPAVFTASGLVALAGYVRARRRSMIADAPPSRGGTPG